MATNPAFDLELMTSVGYQVDPDGMRNLHATLKKRLSQASPASTLSYTVTRADALNYTTVDIEDVLNERNVGTSRIITVQAQSEGDENFWFKMSIGEDRLNFSGEASDRSNLIVFQTDVRNFVEDEFANRRRLGRIPPSSIFWIVAIFFVAASALHALAIQRHEQDLFRAPAVADEAEALDSAVTGARQRLAEFSTSSGARIDELLPNGSTDAKLDYLLQYARLEM